MLCGLCRRITLLSALPLAVVWLLKSDQQILDLVLPSGQWLLARAAADAGAGVQEQGDGPEEEEEEQQPEELTEAKVQLPKEEPKSEPPAPATAVGFEGELQMQLVCRCVQAGDTKPRLSGAVAERVLAALTAEMRSRLRIFTYDLGEGACTHFVHKDEENKGSKIEQLLHDRIQASGLRVPRESQASLFFIPTFTVCWRNTVKERKDAGKQMAKKMKAKLARLAEEHPQFLDLGGKRHFWVAAHYMGKKEPLCKWAESASKCKGLPRMVAENSTGLVNAATPGEAPFAFDPAHDVSLPSNGDSKMSQRALVRVKGALVTRKFSVFFAGRTTKGHAKNALHSAVASIQEQQDQLPFQSESIAAPWSRKFLPKEPISARQYEEALAESDLCVVPRGTRLWSLQLMEMVWFGCVPVIIVDTYYLPGSCYFNWTEMAIFIPEKKAESAGHILMEWLRDPSRLRHARLQLLRVRKHFMWQASTGGRHDEASPEGDAFELAMLDLYLKQQRDCV